ncbi:glycerol-3-phosphate dehydrogenase,mitochondrial [Blumeria hordei DH14]|uniref:Glycerol-3-phosphate dehydrogenase, mitochondrial n=1 Tax=Blumeria graminis f. sp. hordei (strain DH14) TaxID=546991 RepID=N1JEL2_BLUG1|nr:glycerol-3-phosphate dehydrogenase,mitochondrial [Blumeria hordei DH14]
MSPNSRFSRIIIYTSTVALGVGGSTYYSLRSRKSPAADLPTTSAPTGALRPPRFAPIKPRDRQIADLRKSGNFTTDEDLSNTNAGHTQVDNIYDLLVIGAGATGAGIALDAATRGLRVALVERDDFSSGTSSKSTKLVHGGVRYLEKAFWELDYNQYKLVKEALRERRYFLQTAPHLSSWLPIMLPLDTWWKAPYYWIGAKCYDLLAGSEGIESSYLLTRSKALDAFPMLKETNLLGALVYYDGAHNDSRMNVSLAMTAAMYGSTVVNHLEVVGLEKDADGKKKWRKADDFVVRARGVINATGPFTDAIRLMDDQAVKEIVSPSSGVHIVLPGYYSPQNMGLIDPQTSDGRVIFFLPWQGNTIAGTTDAPTSISHNPVAAEEDIDWILSEIRHYLSSDINVRRSDVLAAWSGIRPLVKDPNAKNTESLVRNHLINVSPSGLLTCAGGKWTTYRQMAEEAVDEALVQFSLTPKPCSISNTVIKDDDVILDGSCQTHKVKLVGAHSFCKNLFINLIQYYGLETDVAKHLADSYGDRAWGVAALSQSTNKRFPVRGERISDLYPFIDGEVRYSVHHEYAETAVDVLARRTRLAFLNAQAALEATPKVIDIMASELNWDSQRKDLEWKETVLFLESMGLPKHFLDVTREQVERGILKTREQTEINTDTEKTEPAVNSP